MLFAEDAGLPSKDILQRLSQAVHGTDGHSQIDDLLDAASTRHRRPRWRRRPGPRAGRDQAASQRH